MNQALQHAIKNRDGAALARIGRQSQSTAPASASNEQVIDLLNTVFKQLRVIFPAAGAVMRDQDELNEMKRQWVRAFAENGITSIAMIECGLRHARAQASPFLPSPGQFVSWCKSESLTAAGMPSVEELLKRVKTYCLKRDDYPTPEQYPHASATEYWLVTSLYYQCRQQQWSDAELKKAAQTELSAMSKRILSGEEIPNPIISLQNEQERRQLAQKLSKS